MDAYIHYYHCLRPHSSLAYSTPYDFRRQFFENRCDSTCIPEHITKKGDGKKGEKVINKEKEETKA